MYEEFKKGLDSEIEDSKKSAIVVSVITLIVWVVATRVMDIDYKKYENVCVGVEYFVTAVAARMLAYDITIIFYGGMKKKEVRPLVNENSEEYIHSLLKKDRLDFVAVGAKMGVVFVCGLIISVVVTILRSNIPYIKITDVGQLFAITGLVGIWSGYAKGKSRVNELIG